MTKANQLKALAVVAAMALALCLLGWVAVQPAGAAFPGGNGGIIFSSDRARDAQDIFAISPTGNATDRLTTFTTGHNIDPAVSPDGSRIAFSRDGEIWVMKASGMNAGGTGATQITDTSTVKLKPTWSPDGSRIAFVANSFDVDQQTDLEIWIVNADGSGRTQLTNNTVPIDDQPAWSPDGTQIAFVSARSGDTNRNIYVMDTNPATDDGVSLTANSSVPLYQGHDDHPSWSPDGSQITYSNNGDGDADVYKMDTNPTTKDWTNLTNVNLGVDLEPAWSPDGDSIAYVAASGSTDRNIYMMDANAAGSGAAIDTTVANDISPDWQPVSIRIGDARVKENNTSARFTVSLSGASDQPVTVGYATANGTAKAPADYTAETATLTFSPGQTSKTVTVAVKGDRKNERNETFLVNLSGANTTVADASGKGTIVDND